MKRLFMMLGVMFLSVCTMTPKVALSDEARLSFTVSGSTLTVAAPAGVLDKNTSLYLVYDSADRGAELEKWANSIKYENDVSDAEALYDFDISTVPEKSVMRVLAISEIRLMDGYVSLGEGQYIDTGILATEAYGLEFRFFHTNEINASFGLWESLIGSVRDDFTFGGYEKDYFYLRWYGVPHTHKFYGDLNDSKPHTIKITDGNVYLDSIPEEEFSIGDEVKDNSMGEHSRSILVGSTWENATSTSTSGRYFWANWYYVKLFDGNGNELINLVPALVGSGNTQKTVFYDTVSK
ncbi:MAG: hypothetical protein J6S30_03310, partial [Kiritimatiellae bacterium]|nr:hypothetical protein [Kiritimatiellia bacterium]